MTRERPAIAIRERLGGIGIILFALWLILTGVSALIPLAIPVWVGGLLAVTAGFLILVGR